MGTATQGRSKISDNVTDDVLWTITGGARAGVALTVSRQLRGVSDPEPAMS
jgi:hypothetical protein